MYLKRMNEEKSLPEKIVDLENRINLFELNQQQFKKRLEKKEMEAKLSE